MRSRSLRASVVLFILFIFPAAAQQATVIYQGKQVIARQVILRLRNNDPQALARVAARLSDATVTPIVPSLGVHVIQSNTNTVEALMSAYSPDSDIVYAEPNYILHGTATIPNDSQYSQVWGMPKISAPLAWDLFTGSKSVAVGVIDTGVDYTHPDLAQNVWSAPTAFSVTVGGQTIKCPAGSHGFNALAMSCDPKDDNSHGTHVSGTIGAVGNNSLGVTGVNWTAQIVAIKFLDSSGSGSLSDALNGIEFAIQLNNVFASTSTPVNIRVLSASWGSTDFTQSLLDELTSASNNGMLFVAAAGNAGTNNDSTPFYPAGFAAPNVISVAATDSNDTLASFSNYGAGSVHLSAPGVGILSTVLGGGYASYSGTSMATPHVAGAALLTLSACPALTTAQLKATLLGTVDSVTGLQGKTITGGRLDVGKAVQACRAGQIPSTGFCLASVAADHWKGQYFNNMTLSGNPLMVRDDGTDVLNFNWGNEGSPSSACNMPGVAWSARWTRAVTFSAGTYRFTTVSDDGMRLYVDGAKVMDRWFDQGATTTTTDVPLTAGTHTVVVEYYQNRQGEVAAVSWQQLSGTGCIVTVAADHWKGEYFNNMTLSGSPLMVRDDGTDVLNFNWGNEGSPSSACNMPGAMWSARWTRTVSFSAGTYRFTTVSDDGMRLYVDGVKVMDRWFDQGATTTTTDVPLTAGTHTIVVEYYQNRQGEVAAVSWQLLSSGTGCVAPVAGDHWKGEYFNNMTLSGSPLMVRDDGTDVLNFNWGTEGSPNAGCNIPGRQFSARWTRAVTFSAGTYAFTTSTDDGMRLYIDGQKLQDRWYDQAASPMTSNIALTAGAHTLVVEYYQNTGGDSAAVSWQLLGGPPPVVTTVAITAPAAGATLSGSVVLSAAASTSTPLTITSVQFKIDNGNQGAALTSAPYNLTLDTTKLGNGAHAITVTATDSVGNAVTSAAVSITINNAAPPAGGPMLTSFTTGSPRNGYTGWLGLQFTVGSAPLVVTSLGRIYIAGNNHSHVLKLVNAGSGSDVLNGSVTIALPAGVAGQFTYAQLAGPVTLAANTSYYLVSQELSGADQWFDLNPVTSSSAVSVNGPVFWTGSSWYPLGITGNTYVPVNLIFQ